MARSDQQESIVLQIVFWIADWATLMAFWIALTADFRWSELLIGAGAALIGSMLSMGTEAMTLARFLPHWRYLLSSRSVMWQIPLGVLSVTGALLRHGTRTTGAIRALPFYARGANAESQARRAVAETFPTMAPGSIVIGVDELLDTVVFHLLGTNSAPPTLKRLGDVFSPLFPERLGDQQLQFPLQSTIDLI